MRLLLTGLMLFAVTLAFSQNIESFGVFGGLNIPFTIDQGLKQDPRFAGKVTMRGTPVGLFYGYDKAGYGFATTPSFVKLGQTFKIRNTIGGDVGFREVQMSYVTIPVALKIHINDLSFFRLSLVASLAPSFLIKGQETLSHDATKLKYPAGVSIPTDPGYSVTYDGVFVPELKDFVHVSKDKFNAFQLFAAMGLRSDFDLNDDWSINFDGRANFGIFDSRSGKYLKELKNPAGPPDFFGNPGAPDLYGPRRDVFLSVEIGICRIIQTKEKFHVKQSSHPANTKKAAPKATKGPKKRR